MLYERGKLMENLRKYVESLAAAALICSVIMCLSGEKGSLASLLKLLAGVFLVTVIIRPALNFQIGSIARFTNALSYDYQTAVEAGEQAASEAMEKGITERTAAYIQNEAEQFGCILKVGITLSDQIPSEVILEGNVSPYAKAYLTHWIEENLNIPAEAQQWTG